MALYLVRHGEAKAVLEDPTCPLSERGEAAVRRMAEWAARSGVRVDQIRHSGKRRAEQTALLLAERLDPPAGTIAVEGLHPDDDPQLIADLLQGEPRSLMLVSHLPFLGRLAGILLDAPHRYPSPSFQTSEMVCFSPSPARWSLEWIMSPDRL